MVQKHVCAPKKAPEEVVTGTVDCRYEVRELTRITNWRCERYPHSTCSSLLFISLFRLSTPREIDELCACTRPFRQTTRLPPSCLSRLFRCFLALLLHPPLSLRPPPRALAPHLAIALSSSPPPPPQGPPLWWASKHRRHHGHCDTKDDPHSPVAHGKLYAWLVIPKLQPLSPKP